MDAKEQAAGERRVRELLVEPLQRRGFIKPAGMRLDQFEDMLRDLERRLAYVSAENLMALEEVAAGMASGKERNRFPIAQHILDRAGDIQAPADGDSPLILAVFGHALGGGGAGG